MSNTFALANIIKLASALQFRFGIRCCILVGRMNLQPIERMNGPDAFDWNIKLPSMHQFPNEWNVAAGKSNESKFTASTVSVPVRRTEKHQATKPCQIIRGKLSCELPIMGRLYIRSLCGSLSNIYFRYLRVMTGFSPRYQIAIKYHYLSTCFVHSWRETNYMHKNGRHNESNMCFQPEICNQSMSICRYTERRRG